MKILDSGIIKISIDTKAGWEATSVAIPDGLLCYELDTGSAKVGNDTEVYTNLDYAFDTIPSEIRELINSNSLIIANQNNVIPTSFFPKDVFNIHVVVPDITARDNLAIDTIKNSTLIMVLDATGDPSVISGMAFYIANFTDDTTYVWIKTGEQESIDLDFSNYLLDDTSLDQISDSSTYRRLTPDDLIDLSTRINAQDNIVATSYDYTEWVAVPIVINTNTIDLSIQQILIDRGYNEYREGTQFDIIINEGIYVYSSLISKYALSFENSLNRYNFHLLNYGVILGRGGDGATYPSAGGNGGPGLFVGTIITLFNYNTISGGGGGGGATFYLNSRTYGGGGGVPLGSAGHGAYASGNAASLTVPGAGGRSPNGALYGGTGGNRGLAGNPGVGTQWFSAGGSPGKAIVGNDLIIYKNTGTILGGIAA